MKSKSITISEELYDQICRSLTYYEDKETTAEESAEDMYDLLCDIVRAYEQAEETD